MSNTPYFLALNRMPQVGPKTIRKLLTRWPNLKDCFTLKKSELIEHGVPDKLATALSSFNWSEIDADLRFDEKPNHHLLIYKEANYPTLLNEIHAPPVVLYAIGDLSCLSQPMLSMVGTRHPSYQGKKTAYEWSKSLALAGLTIVSGLAKGIDTAAHTGAVDGGGRTIAVLGSGVNVIYPAQNQFLARRIAEKGLVLSEFPLDFGPKAGHFPRRNRIISGLTRATLIVEAALKSGSLITAHYALEQNRDVFALPGPIYLPQSQGCNHILKEGASLVTCVQELLEAFGLDAKSNEEAQHDRPKDDILTSVDVTPTPVDMIISRSGKSLHEVMSHLATLELSGKVQAVPGGYICMET